MLNAGGKATLPSSVIKSYKIKPREKFVMDVPDEAESGFTFLNKNMEDEVVESLKDDEFSR